MQDTIAAMQSGGYTPSTNPIEMVRVPSDIANDASVDCFLQGFDVSTTAFSDIGSHAKRSVYNPYPDTITAGIIPVVRIGGAVVPVRGGGGARFFELLEDMPGGHGGKAWASFQDWDRDEISQGFVYNWGDTADGIIGYVPSGFFGTCVNIAGRDAFNQAECNQRCLTGTYIPTQTPTDATIGSTSYSYTVSTTGSITSGSFSATGLPSGWAINATTGVITGPTTGGGVLGPARDLAIFVSATAPKTGGGTCSLKRRMIIKIKV